MPKKVSSTSPCSSHHICQNQQLVASPCIMIMAGPLPMLQGFQQCRGSPIPRRFGHDGLMYLAHRQKGPVVLLNLAQGRMGPIRPKHPLCSSWYADTQGMHGCVDVKRMNLLPAGCKRGERKEVHVSKERARKYIPMMCECHESRNR